MVGRNPFQAADGHRLFVDPGSTARRLARPVAGPPEDSRKDIRLAIDEIGLRELALGNEPDVLGHIRMCRAGPLAVDDPVVVLGISGIGWTHWYGPCPCPWKYAPVAVLPAVSDCRGRIYRMIPDLTSRFALDRSL